MEPEARKFSRGVRVRARSRHGAGSARYPRFGSRSSRREPLSLEKLEIYLGNRWYCPIVLTRKSVSDALQKPEWRQRFMHRVDPFADQIQLVNDSKMK